MYSRFEKTPGLYIQRKNLPQTGIMFQDVVIAQCIQTPGRSIRTWVCREREVIQQLRDFFADVKACQKSVLDGGEREVATLTR
jgi:hypothetical protein